MPRLLLLLPALAACSTQATTDGTTDLVDKGEVDSLESRIAALESSVSDAQADADAANARADEMETRLADAEARLDAVEANQGGGDVSADIAALQAALDALGLTVTEHGERLDTIEAGMGNEVWTVSSSTITGGTTSSWPDIGAGLDITITRTDPIIGFCQAHASYGYELLRLTLTSADGSWSASSTEVGPESYVAETHLLAFGSFEPPEAGEYTFSCEGKYSYGWNSYTVMAVQ